jgi:hypothetical protein
MGDGAISNSAVGSSVVSIASSPRTSTTNTIRGVIVGVATLDARVRKMFPNALAFPDAANNVDILTGWNANISNASLTQPVRESLRIYKRTLLINN